MAESLVKKTFSGIIWSAIDRFSSQGLAFIFNILIARLLLPSDYGVIAMLGIFIAIAQTFIDSGFATALIRNPNRTENDSNTVFYFNIIVSLIAYLILWIAAPYIASFYDIPLLTTVTRVVSLKLIFNAFATIQGAFLSIRIEFKSRAKIRLVVCVITGAIGLYMAKHGYGVWALITQELIDSIFGAVLLWLVIKWRPKWIFSWASFKSMFSYGSKILATGLFNTLYNNIYTLVVGKFFSASDLGNYSKASSFSGFLQGNISGVLMSVFFPVLSTIQEDRERFVQSNKKILSLSSFIIFPISIGLCVVAEPLIVLVLKDQWTEMIPFFRILCFASMWGPLNSLNTNVLMVLGRSDCYLKQEVYKKILGTVILVVTIPLGLTAMCIGQVVNAVIALVVNGYYTKLLISYGFMEEMKDVLHVLILSLIMGAFAMVLISFFSNIWLRLLVPSIGGAVFYFAVAYSLHMKEFFDLREIILKALNR